MQFDSLSDFIQMNGHGIYVWTVYILGVAILVMNVIRPKMLQKKFYLEQAKILKMQNAMQAEQEEV